MLRGLVMVAAAAMAVSSARALECTVDAGGFPATLATADAGGAVVIIVAGSGPTDRDGNNALGVKAGYLAKLAALLAARNVASLRYDKRGLPGSVPAGNEAEITFETFVADLGAVARWAQAAFPGRPVVLLGHSEGGMVALEAARRAPGGYAGLVLLSAPGRSPGETLRDQFPNLPEPTRGEALAILSELEAGHRVDVVPAALTGLFRPSVQPFLMSMLALLPAETLASLRIPALVIGGGTDFQVGRTDFEALAASRPDVERRWYEHMNHILVDAPADFGGNVATYGDPDVELTDGLADVIADFVKRAGR